MGSRGPDGGSHKSAASDDAVDAVSSRRTEIASVLDTFATWLIRSRSRRGMSLTSVSTLGSLERDGPMRLCDLAEREGVAQPSMTALITRLEAAGLAARRRDPEDRRAVNVEITDGGRAVLARRRAQRSVAVAALLGELTPEEEAALAAAAPVLRRFTANPPPQPEEASRP